MSNTTDDALRGTGRTTAGMLSAIATALQRPGDDIEFVDHCPQAVSRSCALAAALGDLCQAIGLRHMTVRSHSIHVYVRSDILAERSAMQKA